MERRAQVITNKSFVPLCHSSLSFFFSLGVQIPRLPVKDAHGNLIVAKEYRKLGADKSDEDDSEAEAEVKEEGAEDGDEGDDMDHDETDGASIKDEDEVDEEDDEDDDEEEDDEDEEEKMEVEQAAKKEKKGKEMVSELQKFHSRQEQNEHTKMHIAHLCTKIIEDPEENVRWAPLPPPALVYAPMPVIWGC